MNNSDHFQNGRSRFHLDRKMVVVVTFFIVAACGIVVLTDLYINTMSAISDFTSLQVYRSQAHQKMEAGLKKYALTGNAADYQAYRLSETSVEDVDNAINELFQPSPDIRSAYKGFKPMAMSPNEINSLVISFPRLRSSPDFQKLSQIWGRIYQHEIQFPVLASRIHDEWQEFHPSQARIETLIQQINTIDRDMPLYAQSLLSTSGSLARWIKNAALWTTVLMGILLVLTAIVFSVRGFKSIRKWERVLKERDDLARFTELDFKPILRLTRFGQVIYANPAARRLFPGIMERNLNHPFLSHLHEPLLHLDLTTDSSFTEIVEFGGAVYRQNIHYFRKEKCLHVYGLDVTESMKQDQKVRMSLREKEILLSEVHHRVKNSLAMISGLIQLQMMDLDEGEIQTALQESETRVRSMAMIYEILYRSDSFSEINMKTCLEELTEKICGMYIKNGEQLSVHYSLKDVYLNINQVIPAGLIVNELLVNIMEQVVSDAHPAELVLNLQERKDQVSLSIEVQGADGKSFKPVQTKDSLSSNIIHALLDQLNAEMEMKGETGYRISIRFGKNDHPGSANALFQHRDSEIYMGKA